MASKFLHDHPYISQLGLSFPSSSPSNSTLNNNNNASSAATAPQASLASSPSPNLKNLIINLETSHVRNINGSHPHSFDNLNIAMGSLSLANTPTGMVAGIPSPLSSGGGIGKKKNEALKKKKNVFDLHLAKIVMLPVGADSVIVSPSTLPFNPNSPMLHQSNNNRSLLTQCDFERSRIKFRLRLVPPAGLCVLIDGGIHEIVIPFEEVEWFGIQDCGGIDDGLIFEMGIVPGFSDTLFSSRGRRGGKSLRIRQPNKYLPATHDFTGGVIDQTRIIRMWVNPTVSNELAGGVGDMVIRELMHRDHQISPTALSHHHHHHVLTTPVSRSLTPSASSASASSTSSSPRTSSLSDLPPYPITPTNQNKILFFIRQSSRDKFRPLLLSIPSPVSPQAQAQAQMSRSVTRSLKSSECSSPWNQSPRLTPIRTSSSSGMAIGMGMNNGSGDYLSASEYTKRERGLSSLGGFAKMSLPLTPPLTPIMRDELNLGEGINLGNGCVMSAGGERDWSRDVNSTMNGGGNVSNFEKVQNNKNKMESRVEDFDTTPNPNWGFKSFVTTPSPPIGSGGGNFETKFSSSNNSSSTQKKSSENGEAQRNEERRGGRKRMPSNFGVIGGERKPSGSGSSSEESEETESIMSMMSKSTTDNSGCSSMMGSKDWIEGGVFVDASPEQVDQERFPLHFNFTSNSNMNFRNSNAFRSLKPTNWTIPPQLARNVSAPVSSLTMATSTRQASGPIMGATQMGQRHFSLPAVGMTASSAGAGAAGQAWKQMDESRVVQSMVGWIWNEDPLFDVKPTPSAAIHHNQPQHQQQQNQRGFAQHHHQQQLFSQQQHHQQHQQMKRNIWESGKGW